MSRFQVGVCVLHVPLCVAMMALALPSGCLACRGVAGSAVLRRAAVVPFRSAANMKSAPQPRRFSGIRNTASVNGALPGLARNVWDQEKQVWPRELAPVYCQHASPLTSRYLVYARVLLCLFVGYCIKFCVRQSAQSCPVSKSQSAAMRVATHHPVLCAARQVPKASGEPVGRRLRDRGGHIWVVDCVQLGKGGCAWPKCARATRIPGHVCAAVVQFHMRPIACRLMSCVEQYSCKHLALCRQERGGVGGARAGRQPDWPDSRTPDAVERRLLPQAGAGAVQVL